MIQLVVGWFVGLIDRPRNKVAFREKEKITPSQMGYRFEHDELKRLMKRLERFETVEFNDAYGNSLSPGIIDKRFGSDGGIDCIIRIIASTERGASNVQLELKILLSTETIDGEKKNCS